MRFTLSAIISFGAILKIIYQSYGLAGLPVFLIKGTKSLEAENSEIEGTIASVRQQLRVIQEKYQRNQKNHISAKDKAILKKLRKEESILASKQLKITNKIQSDERKKRSLWKFISWILKMLTPFRVAIGIFCLKISLLIVYSMLITNIDRLFNSECGYKCGYLLEKSPSFFNPLDWTLKMLSNHHENFYSVQLFLDTTFFAIILLYTFICILYGIVKIGINFFSFEIFRIRRRDTMP